MALILTLFLIYSDSLINGIRVEQFAIEETRYVNPSFLDSTIHAGYRVLDSLPGGEVMLTWTAVGDDGYDGTATGYDFQWGIDADMPNHLTLEPAKASGERESLLIVLEPATGYYFAVRAYDEVPNYGGQGNVVYKVSSPIWYEQIREVIDTTYLTVRTYPDSIPVPPSATMFGNLGIENGLTTELKNHTTLHISAMRRKDLSMDDFVDVTDLATMIHYLTVK